MYLLFCGVSIDDVSSSFLISIPTRLYVLGTGVLARKFISSNVVRHGDFRNWLGEKGSDLIGVIIGDSGSLDLNSFLNAIELP